MTKKPVAREAAASPKKPDEILLTLPELAAYLHLDEKTVYKLVTTGKLPSVGGERSASRGPVAAICDQLEARRERYGISYVTFGATAMEAVAPIVERLAGR